MLSPHYMVGVVLKQGYGVKDTSKCDSCDGVI